MRKYEIMFIIDPKIPDIKPVTDKIKEYVKSNNGEIIKEDDMGLKKLEYMVKKRDKGHYYIIQTELDQKDLPELEREIKVDENILKYLLTLAKN